MSTAEQPFHSQIGLPPEQFEVAFPFHLALDQHLTLRQVGRTLRRVCPDAAPGRQMTSIFRVLRPEGECSFEWLVSNQRELFLLTHLASGLQLRGQFIVLPAAPILLFLGSPWFTDSAEVAERGLGFEDFAIHDSVVDLLQVSQAQKMALGDAKKLLAKLSTQQGELRAANERLQRQEADTRKLALIAARTDNAVVLTDDQGRTVWVNEGFTRLTGYTLAEMLGKKPGSVLQGPGTDPETVRQIGQQLRRGEGFSVEILNYGKDGRSYWLAIEVQPIHDEQGRVTNFMAIEMDITARRAAQQRLAIQFEVSRVLAGETHYSEAISEVLRVICENLDWQVGQVWRLAGERLRLVEVWHPPAVRVPEFIAASRAITFERGVGLPGRIWATAQPAWIADATRDANFPRAKVAVEGGLRGGFGFPVFVRGELWGVVEFFSRKIEEPDAALLKTFGAVGNQIGQFIVRREAEEELRKTNALQQAILEGANYSIISTAPDGTIFTFNSAAERMLGYTSEEVVGKVTPAIIHDSSEVAARAAELTHELGRPVEPGFEAFVAKAALGKPDEREWTYIRKDGSRFPVLLSVTALFDERGKVTGYLGIALDITERKRAASELLAAKQAAEAANQAKSEFLATISHELRTPLTSIRGFLQTLLSDPDMSAQARQEFLTITHDQSLRLSRLVDDLLDLSSLESGRTQFNDERLDLRQIAETCLAGIAPLADSKSQRVEAAIADSLPAFHCDAVRLQSVFTNLLSNAVKFTPAGGTVRLELGVSHNAIRIVVQDTGPGIPADQHKMIFEKFHRVYRRGASTSGTGLGLPIVKAIVEHYHGRIELQTEVDRGATFRIYLPFEAPASAPA